jgi:hypothetical protein
VEQWQVFPKTIIPPQAGSGITAAGTVTDSNRIPFSLQWMNFIATPTHYKDICFYQLGKSHEHFRYEQLLTFLVLL